MAKEKTKNKNKASKTVYEEPERMTKLSIRIPANLKAQYRKKLIEVDETMQNHVLLMILHYLKHGDFCAAKA